MYWFFGKLFFLFILRFVEIKSVNYDLICNILFYDNVNNDIIIMIIIELMKYLYIFVVLIYCF